MSNIPNIIFYQVDLDRYDLYEYDLSNEVYDVLPTLGSILGRRLVRCDKDLVIGAGSNQPRRLALPIIVDDKSINEEAYVSFKKLTIYCYRMRMSKL